MTHDEIKEDLINFLKSDKDNVYNDKHCALNYMLHLDCNICRLKMKNDCMSNPIPKRLK